MTMITDDKVSQAVLQPCDRVQQKMVLLGITPFPNCALLDWIQRHMQ